MCNNPIDLMLLGTQPGDPKWQTRVARLLLADWSGSTVNERTDEMNRHTQHWHRLLRWRQQDTCEHGLGHNLDILRGSGGGPHSAGSRIQRSLTHPCSPLTVHRSLVCLHLPCCP